MKKMLVFASLIGVTQTVYAAKPDQPWLLTPLSSPALPTSSPVAFSWSNTKAAKVTNYRLIVATTKDFSGYNQKTKSCRSKTTCFMTTLKGTSYSLPNTNAIFKIDTNYYWRVEAINNDGVSISDIRAFAFGAPTTAIDAKYATVAMPNVTAVTTDNPSVEQGKPIKISATLDAALPSSYFVKVNYGNGLVTMTNSATGFDYTATPTKSASYAVGIYDAKNVLKSNKMTGSFEVTTAVPTNVAPTLTLISKTNAISSIEVNKTYTVQLSAKDGNDNLRQINMDWGDGSSDSINVEDGETLSLTHLYTKAGSVTWKATADDYSDTTSNVISQAVTVTAPVVSTTSTTATTTTSPSTTTTDTTVTPRYVAINSSGETITGGNDWACTRDEETGLIWELKTNNGGLHDKDWTYSWYEPDTSKNGNYAGVQYAGTCRGSAKCNTYEFINAVNAEKLCGGDNWRLPTKAELEGLVSCSDEKSTTLGSNEQGTICTGKPSAPTIDTIYFPNTPNDWFWTSNSADLPVVDKSKTAKNSGTLIPYSNSTAAWNVIFYNGYSRADHKGNAAGVRLVREETTTTTATTSTTTTTTVKK